MPTPSVPVTPVVKGNPLALVNVPEDGVPRAPPFTTKAPADPTLVPKAVATPVPNPEMPVLTGRPVALVRVMLDGVPKAPEKIVKPPVAPVVLPSAVATPVPRDVIPVPPADGGNVPVVKAEVDVAYMAPPDVNEVRPVPPLPLVSAVPSVRAPAFVTLNLLIPPTCKSIKREPLAEAVSVMFSLIPVNVVPNAFQVCVELRIGIDVVRDPLATLRDNGDGNGMISSTTPFDGFE